MADQEENFAATASRGKVAAPGSPAFEFHTLGWRAFQDLCAAVLRQVWGQSVQAFADSNDAGRDGAFYGNWRPLDGSQSFRDLPSGPFVLQCKHTKNAGETLSFSSLEDEFKKVPGLVRRGLCKSYVLVTNARVSGATDEKVRSRLLQLGVKHPLLLGGHWLSATIASSKELRLFVPRVYGLGDLSQILDERAYDQASLLIASAQDQVKNFVVTRPYEKAARALRDHGFVLLLGEPGIGKSVIALMLAVAAADNWDCLTIKARTPNELINHWNPHEPNQFFWIDDAFGAVRHEEQLADEWSRSLSHVMAAIEQGTKIVLTSRSYIYEEARPKLKTYAYPRLHEQHVTVDAESLTLDERRQILYNHLAHGDQPQTVRRQMKPHLDQVARVDPFRPEMARRLSKRAFTLGMRVNSTNLKIFMTGSTRFLQDIYDQLVPEQQAALALVYAAGEDGLENPIDLNQEQRDLLQRAGGSIAGATKALRALTGDFLRHANDSFGTHGWVFRHPTLQEGFASWMSLQPNLITVVISGLSDRDLLTKVDCEAADGDQREGVLLRVPPPLYLDVARRLADIGRRPRRFTDDNSYVIYRGYLGFLARRSCPEFLRTYLEIDPQLPETMLKFTSYLNAVSEPSVLAKLWQCGLLSESQRMKAVSNMAELATDTPDAGWIANSAWDVLLTEDDREHLMEAVESVVTPNLEEFIDNWFGYTDSEPDEYSPLYQTLQAYGDAFREHGRTETAEAFERACEYYSESNHYDPAESTRDVEYHSTRLPTSMQDRSIFDDL